MTEGIRVSLDGPLARITICRPPLNILTTRMIEGIAAALEQAESLAEPRVLVLDAEGKVFSAGVDVGDHMGDRVRPMMDALVRLFERFERISLPTVSLVHGAALGGGCEVVMGTDLCLASERASFGQPEVRLGVFAPPASVLLPRLVGERRALDLLLSGETVPAERAERIGLVNRVFPADRFAEESEAFLGRLLELSGSALRFAKRAVREQRNLGGGEAQRALARLYLDDLMKTEDASEGLAAFTEKRSPRWKHR